MNRRLIKINIILWIVVLVISITWFIVLALKKNINFTPYFSFNLGSSNRSEFIAMEEQIVRDDISDVLVDWISGDVNILKSKNNEIKIVQMAGVNFSQDELFSYKINKGKLSIVDGRKGKFKIGININNNGTDLEVYLPEDEFNSININSVSSNITAENIKADKLIFDTTSGDIKFSGEFSEVDIRTVSGKIKCDNLYAQCVNFDTTSGDIIISGSLTELDINTISGDVEIHSSKMIQNIKSNAISGDVSITIPENDGFTIDFDKVSGKLESDFAFITSGDRHTYKNGTLKFSAKAISGDFKISRE